MNINLNKIKTYLGFAKRSNTLVYGTDNILKSKKLQFVLMSKSIAESSYKKIINHLDKYNIDYVEMDSAQLNELLDSENVKVVAVNNVELANAIKKNLTI